MHAFKTIRGVRLLFPAALTLAATLGIAMVATDGRAAGGKRDDLATVERDAFTIDVKNGAAKAGVEAHAVVTLKAKGTFHVNQQYPHKLTVEDVPAGLRVEKSDLKKADATLDEHSLAFKVVATPEKRGKYTLNATLKTSVCDDKQCILKTEKLVLRITGK
jgi:hypothetical protein